MIAFFESSAGFDERQQVSQIVIPMQTLFPLKGAHGRWLYRPTVQKEWKDFAIEAPEQHLTTFYAIYSMENEHPLTVLLQNAQ